MSRPHSNGKLGPKGMGDGKKIKISSRNTRKWIQYPLLGHSWGSFLSLLLPSTSRHLNPHDCDDLTRVKDQRLKIKYQNRMRKPIRRSTSVIDIFVRVRAGGGGLSHSPPSPLSYGHSPLPSTWLPFGRSEWARERGIWRESVPDDRQMLCKHAGGVLFW